MAHPIRIALFCCMLSAAACTSYSPGTLGPGATADEVRAKMGAPTGTWRESGGEVLEYARGPEGAHTYLVHVDGAGRVSEIRQVLHEKTFDRIEIGKSTKDDVRRLIGRPAHSGALWRTGESWDYRYLDRMTRMRVSVVFDDGGVVRQLVRIEDPAAVSPIAPD